MALFPSFVDRQFARFRAQPRVDREHPRQQLGPRIPPPAPSTPFAGRMRNTNATAQGDRRLKQRPGPPGTDRHTILAPFAPVNAPSNPAATRHSARFAAPCTDRRLHAVTRAC